MNIKQLTMIYFSPSGTIKKLVQHIAECFEAQKKYFDLLKTSSTITMDFVENDLLIVGMPVYAGRIPQICIPYLEKLKGNNAKAICVVGYGNRAYEDALLELTTIISQQGFDVVSAGAFITQHSIFTKAGIGRPDILDEKILENFAEKSKSYLEETEKITKEKIKVKGNFPYREIKSIPLKPKGNSQCIGCKACANICPVGAIDKKIPRETNENLCISCTACVAICPVKARSFPKIPHSIAQKVFLKKNNEYKEPDLFFK